MATRLLERIVLDDRDLHLDRLRDEGLEAAEGVAFFMDQTMPLATLELGEEVRSRDQRMLDDLGHPGRRTDGD